MSQHASTVTDPADPESPDTATTERAPRDWAPLLTAIVAALASAAIIAVITVLNPNPFREHQTDLWLAAGAFVTVLVATVTAFAPTLRVWAARFGVVAFSVWTAGFLAAQTAGSPYNYQGVLGDVGRFSALATRFTVTWRTSDPFVQGQPAEYPPLFPWIIGRTAVLFDVPAWKLLFPASALGVSLAIIGGWLLWRRIVGDLTGLLVVVAAVSLSGATPRKPFEVIALALFVPWVIAVFMRLKRSEGGLGWLGGGLVGGLMLCLYQAYFLFCVLALVGLTVYQLTKAPRWPYLKHLALTAVTAFVVASWYLVPWLWAGLTRPSEQVSDMFKVGALKSNRYFLPWEQPFLLALVLFGGIALIVWNIRRTTWAKVLFAVVLSAYLFRFGASYRYEFTGHTLFFHYTSLPIEAGLVSGLVLGVREEIVRIRGAAAQRWIPAATAVLASACVVISMAVTIDDLGINNSLYAQQSHGERLPSGKQTEYAEYVAPVAPFPALDTIRAIDREFGDYALPVLLSDAERLNSFYPVYVYLSRDRTASSSLQNWDAKEVNVVALTKISDPAAFAAASANLPDGGTIDGFVLLGRDPLKWNRLEFRPEQFGEQWFEKVELPGYTVYLRKGAQVEHHVYPR